jgi:hypothetical protein
VGSRGPWFNTWQSRLVTRLIPHKTARRRLLAGGFDPHTVTSDDAAVLEELVDQMEFLGMLVDLDLIDYDVVAVFIATPLRVFGTRRVPSLSICARTRLATVPISKSSRSGMRKRRPAMTQPHCAEPNSHHCGRRCT